MSESMPNTEPEISSGKLPRVHVVAGIIKNDKNQVFLAKRAEHQHQGGLWEFPGGKRERGEDIYDALCRELNEELGISVLKANSFKQIAHDYKDKAVLLDFWLVESYQGEPKGLEGQSTTWASIQKLSSYEFPEANIPIVTRLQQDCSNHDG